MKKLIITGLVSSILISGQVDCSDQPCYINIGGSRYSTLGIISCKEYEERLKQEAAAKVAAKVAAAAKQAQDALEAAEAADRAATFRTGLWNACSDCTMFFGPYVGVCYAAVATGDEIIRMNPEARQRFFGGGHRSGPYDDGKEIVDFAKKNN